MNEQDNARPTQLDYSETDIVEVINPTTEDFKYTVGRSNVTSDGKSRDQRHSVDEYVIKAGATAKIEGFKADLYIKKIVDQMIQEDGKTLNMGVPEVRREYEEKVYIGKIGVDLLTPEQENRVAQISEEEVKLPDSGSGDIPIPTEEKPFAEVSSPEPKAETAPKVNTARKK